MDIQEFVDNLFDFNGLQVDEKKNIHTPIEDRILEILTPSYLRIGPLDDELTELLRKRIRLSIKRKLPIKLILAVGGFKNVKIDSSPHIDWAEVFQLSFLLKTLWEISQVYEPGLHIEYSGDSEAMTIVDNLKLEDIAVYNKEYDQLLEYVQKHLPQNIKLSSKNFLDFYEIDFMRREVEKKIVGTDKSDPKVTPLIADKMRHAQNNFQFDGEVDLTNVNNWDELLENSILAHKYWLEVDYDHRKDYLEGGTHIPVAHRKFPGCYAICSIRGSDLQYWICKGVLKVKEGKCTPALLSPKVLDEQVAKIENIPVNFGVNGIESLKTLPVVQE